MGDILKQVVSLLWIVVLIRLYKNCCNESQVSSKKNREDLPPYYGKHERVNLTEYFSKFEEMN